jgi:hypothetical protein
MTKQPPPPLVVEFGQSIDLSPGVYIYSSIEIKSGARLNCKLSSTPGWLVLYSLGDVSVQGSINANGIVPSGVSTYTILVPNGEQVSHTYSHTQLGGRGGRGGSSACTLSGGGSVFQPGGGGANGSIMTGGGGGAGGGLRSWNNCQGQVIKGNDANGIYGGTTIGGYVGTKGGDGARLFSDLNGGLIYIFCGGNFDGYNGQINAYGFRGRQGDAGGSNIYSPTIQGGCGGAGGGGGSPGAEGGVVMIRTKTFSLFPSVNVSGGPGGAGGQGGSGFANLPSIPSSYGEAGQPGETGGEGIININHKVVSASEVAKFPKSES